MRICRVDDRYGHRIPGGLGMSAGMPGAPLADRLMAQQVRLGWHATVKRVAASGPRIRPIFPTEIVLSARERSP
ncbi:hypothetical protein [Gandjariella thermophila]|nr:hypothetical protein [Gandjariella thermophila]